MALRDVSNTNSNVIRYYGIDDISNPIEAVAWICEARSAKGLALHYISLTDLVNRSDEGSGSVQLEPQTKQAEIKKIISEKSIDIISLNAEYDGKPIVIGVDLRSLLIFLSARKKNLVNIKSVEEALNLRGKPYNLVASLSPKRIPTQLDENNLGSGDSKDMIIEVPLGNDQTRQIDILKKGRVALPVQPDEGTQQDSFVAKLKEYARLTRNNAGKKPPRTKEEALRRFKDSITVKTELERNNNNIIIRGNSSQVGVPNNDGSCRSELSSLGEKVFGSEKPQGDISERVLAGIRNDRNARLTIRARKPLRGYSKKNSPSIVVAMPAGSDKQTPVKKTKPRAISSKRKKTSRTPK